MLTKQIYFKLNRLRWHIRKQHWIAATVYTVPNFFYAVMALGLTDASTSKESARGRVALCLRFRDEAPYLGEWIDYHLATGIEHFFLYNNFSADDYYNVLKPYIQAKRVTLIDWPKEPASPRAEHDCIARSRGRFEWVGFIDVDEFVVVDNGEPIPHFLEKFPDAPAVAFHWYYFGSNSHKKRPKDRVIYAYTRRASDANRHFKVFVRPDKVTRNRNSHNFYYREAQRAVREDNRRVYGSMAPSPSVKQAWINHYHCKSLEDYLEKAGRRSTLDRRGVKEQSRSQARADMAMDTANEVFDDSAIQYFESRTSGRERNAFLFSKK